MTDADLILTERLLRQVRARPDAAAVTEGDRTLTYRELAGAVLSAADDIAKLTERSNVGIALPSCMAFPCAFFGIIAAGKTAVPLNLLFTPEQIGFTIVDSNIDTIITSRQLQASPAGIAGGFEGGAPKLLFVEDILSGLSRQLVNWQDENLPHVQPDRPAMMIYTSGTTGTPKGVVLTHRNLVRNVESAAELFDYNENDVSLGVLPAFHVLGTVVTIILPLINGAHAIFHPRFVPRKVLAAIPGHGVTVICAVPAMYRAIVSVSDAAATDVSSLRYCVAGGAALGHSIAGDFERIFGIPLLEGYGLTETSPVIALNHPDMIVRGSVGRPLSWAKVKIADDCGNEVPAGEEGELLVRGDCVMQGYHKNPEADAEAFTPDGWFRTGDVARIDENGYIFITGRKKELIISGGENIAPAEIEDVVAGHPAVADVGVVAIPDEARGEAPKALVVLHPETECTERDIIEHCRRCLPRVKWPKAVQFIDEMPRNPAGKVMRRLLPK